MESSNDVAISVVTGIYTDNYRRVVDIQRHSCCDNYTFDFEHITDEEWQRSKSSADFAFYGGNTIKTQLVINKIKQYWGRIIVVADADVVFLKPTENQLLTELGNKDMLFLKERFDSVNHPFEKAPLNINIGFIVVRCNERSLAFWEKVQEDTSNNHGWDQEVANQVAKDDSVGLQWALLSDMFLNGGDVTKRNVKSLLVTTACGTVAQRNNLTKAGFLSKILAIAQGKDNKWLDGSAVE